MSLYSLESCCIWFYHLSQFLYINYHSIMKKSTAISWLNTIWPEIRDSRFRIQDSRFNIQTERYENAFQKEVPDFINSKDVSTIFLLQDFYFIQKFSLSNAGTFHKNPLSVTRCTFGMPQIRPLKPNRFKNQFSDTLNILGHNSSHQQEFIKRRTAATLHHWGCKLNFPKHFY